MIPGMRKSYILRMHDRLSSARDVTCGCDAYAKPKLALHHGVTRPLFQYPASFCQSQAFTGPQNQLMLCAITRQELETVTQSIPIAHNRAQLKRSSTRG